MNPGRLLSPLDPWINAQTTRSTDASLVAPLFGAPWETNHGHVWRRDFPSVSKLVSTMDQDLNVPELMKCLYHGNGPAPEVLESKTREWNGCKTLVRNGWTKGAQQLMREVRAQLDKTSRLVQAQEPYMDIEGSDYDIGSYMTGNPAHWINDELVIKRGHDRTGPIRLVIQHAISSGAGMERLIARGAAALTVATLLERSGRPTEIVSADAGQFYCNDNGKGRYKDNWNAYCFWTTRVKTMSQPLNYPAMSFAIAHSSMERLLYLPTGAQIWEILNPDRAAKGESYNAGGVLNVPVGNESDTITIDYTPNNISLASADGIFDYVVKILRAQGVTLSQKAG